MNNRSNLHLILWDIDGTLMHCGSDGTKALNRTFEELYGIDNAFYQAGIGSAMDSVILDRIMDQFQLNKEELERVKQTYVDILKKILEQNQNKKILPGVQELLTSIKESENGFSALLTSNLRIGAETKLQSVGLHSFFEVGGFGDELGEKWDAALRGISEAENHFGVTFSRENIYLIGDSAYDIECAKKIGIKSIGVATGWMAYESLKEHSPDYLYTDLSDWEQLIIYQKLVKKEVVK
ncbi:HAD family hydrolase [Sinanaerobacter chloroacetimidivorans]|uniref:HAD family hydrolase n=1 Tax=Sinanaerobacter chloroacetimidivorans TaxID=2818044 RepID=A0A8J7W1B0_9FIRM|nr:HAD family hydrolase [Sinanaerobacter chloroacetimidivorans]MBR0598992.1 HAD family hydrolase [Sinanaerobacter chloroacetimidivorans]